MQAVKKIRNTNIRVQYIEAVDTKSAAYLLGLIKADDQQEVAWMTKQRPLQNMIHPAEAFNQGIKSLKPAVMFNTYSEDKAKERRLFNQKLQAKRTKAYRAKNVKASEVLKALGDRKKLVVRDAVDEFESDPVLKQMPARKFKAKENLAGGLGGKQKKFYKVTNGKPNKRPKTAIGKSL